MLFAPVGCPTCQRTAVVRDGHTPERKPRFHGRHLAWQRPAFRLEYPQKGLLPEVNTQIVDRARHGSGSRATARVLTVSPTPVLETCQTSPSAAIRA